MLSQDYFRQNGYPYGWETPDIPKESTSESKTSQTRLQQVMTWVELQIGKFKARLQQLRAHL